LELKRTAFRAGGGAARRLGGGNSPSILGSRGRTQQGKGKEGNAERKVVLGVKKRVPILSEQHPGYRIELLFLLKNRTYPGGQPKRGEKELLEKGKSRAFLPRGRVRLSEEGEYRKAIGQWGGGEIKAAARRIISKSKHYAINLMALSQGKSPKAEKIFIGKDRGAPSI